MSKLNYKERQIDYLEDVSAEINIMMGLKTEVVNSTIEVDTIVGKIKFRVSFGELMQDVYRFIYIYGMKLQNYGIEQRIKYTV